MSRMAKVFVAEAIGTGILVLGGPGSAMIATGNFGGPSSSIGRLGVALAFGLSLLCAAYLFGHISGCHINPAVTIGMWALRRTEGREVPAYLVGQIIGAALGALALYGIFETGKNLGKGVTRQSLFSGASNGYGSHSPSGFHLGAVIITEVLFTGLFVLVIAGTTRKAAIVGFAGIPIGLMLTLVHLVTIPIDNTSVNPARSFATAIFADSWAFKQLWVFIVFPLVGAAIAALIWRLFEDFEESGAEPASPQAG
jgi:aquaporin Z